MKSLITILLLLVVATSTVAAATRLADLKMNPDEKVKVTCSTELKVVSRTKKEIVLKCKPGASSTPAPTATPVPTSRPTPTVAPTPVTPVPTATPVPTSVPSPTPSAIPTPLPTAAPTPAPPTQTGLVGYGKGVTGGTQTVIVRSLAELRAAIKPNANIVIQGSGTWNLEGRDLAISVANLTIDNRQAGVVLKGGSILIRPPAGNIMLRHVKVRAGDEYGNGQDLDAITVNAQTGTIQGLYFDHVEAWWGPDVTMAILNDVRDVTLDGTIVAGGLIRSTHPESDDDPDGHGLGLNLSALSGGSGLSPSRITLYRSIIALHQGRNPQIRGGGPVDIVDSVIYGHDEAPYGNVPGGLNILGSVYQHGGVAARSIANAKSERMPFRALAKDGSLSPGTVFVDSRTRAVDFTFEPVDPAVRAVAPKVAPSVQSAGGDTLSIVLGYAGARVPRVDAVTQSLFDTIRRGDGQYYNGHGHPPPNPVWE